MFSNFPKRPNLTVVAMVVGMAAALFAKAFATDQMADAPNPAEWRMYGNGPSQLFYSPIDQINDKNVSRLGLAWSVDLPTRDGPVGNILVADGIAYESAAESRIFAVDLKAGKLLWEFNAEINFVGGSLGTFIGARLQRGLALDGDNLFISTPDCRTIAIDKKTGQKIWDKKICEKESGLMGRTGAPHVGNGLVFTGATCGDMAQQRGITIALDQKTGDEKWRFYGVPRFPEEPAGGQDNAALEMAAKTWGSSVPQEQVACGGNWEGITYDPVLNQVYVSTSGTVPWRPDERGKDAGDELFAGSIVALNADTGDYVWHYKLAAHDGWNWEAFQSIVTDLTFDTQKRRVVMNAPKHGFLITLDAKTGKFISGDQIARVNWAKGFDPEGRPIVTGDANYWEKGGRGTITYPGVSGAHSWQPMSYSPQTGLVYVPVSNGPTLMAIESNVIGGAEWGSDYTDAHNPQSGALVAIDPVNHKIRWEITQQRPSNGGVLSTAGNLVFQGTASGYFEVRGADSGKLLWSKYLGGSLQGAPSTVMIGAEQYILLPFGNSTSASQGLTLATLDSCEDCRQAPSRILAFKLGAPGVLPPNPKLQPVPKPPLQRFADALSAKGKHLYASSGCDNCHGMNMINGGGKTPDLHRTNEARHSIFAEIVRGGLLNRTGMPRFSYLTDDDLKALQAYIINNAWTAYQSDDKKAGRHN
jgi:PQQ-dependent dehydrogenase (methanol/ethanol family)